MTRNAITHAVSSSILSLILSPILLFTQLIVLLKHAEWNFAMRMFVFVNNNTLLTKNIYDETVHVIYAINCVVPKKWGSHKHKKYAHFAWNKFCCCCCVRAHHYQFLCFNDMAIFCSKYCDRFYQIHTYIIKERNTQKLEWESKYEQKCCAFLLRHYIWGATTFDDAYKLTHFCLKIGKLQDYQLFNG